MSGRAAGLGDVVREGLRVATGRDPAWKGGSTGPAVLLFLVAVSLAGQALWGRLQVDGDAEFYPWSLGTGWLPFAGLVLLGWVVARRSGPDEEEVLDGATVLAWLMVSSWCIGAWLGIGHALLARWPAWPSPGTAGWMPWILLATGLGWQVVVQALLVVRALPRGRRRAGALGLVLLQAAACYGFAPSSLWYPVRPEVDETAGPELPVFTQQVVESQSRELVAALDGLLPQRPGMTDLYAITFAPYAEEDVFSREVSMVGEVLRERFDTGGRQLNLQNHRTTVAKVPWATPLNLERAIGRMSERMDPQEDVLFLHLTSHGARDGHLAARFFPLHVDEVTPQDLRRWLDDAGIQHAVISISACFSGSWIPSLQAPGTLVMTAADATHTSYGCGRLSELTFFGRAVYDEQLRRTRSFEAAHAAALPVIDAREKEAGKQDGPSNPQIWVGPDIRPRLADLERRLEAGEVSGPPP